MQALLMSAAVWQTVWLVLSLGCLVGGAALAIAAWRSPPIGTDPHCPKCSYNLTGVASSVCPECGAPRRQATCRRCGHDFADSAAFACPQCATPRVMDTAVRGEPRRRSGILAAGIVLLVCGLTGGVTVMAMARPTTAPVRGSVTNNLRNAKALIASLRQTCAAGQVVMPAASAAASQAVQGDTRLAIVALLVQDKIPYVVSKRVTDPKVSGTALSQVKTAGQLIQSQMLPLFEKASRSGNPADAKALVPLLDQLDKQMDALLVTLKGY
jgi:hypothetical protein